MPPSRDVAVCPVEQRPVDQPRPYNAESGGRDRRHPAEPDSSCDLADENRGSRTGVRKMSSANGAIGFPVLVMRRSGFDFPAAALLFALVKPLLPV
jgi:hypothetical protein